jgi:hypothetical protein
MNEQIDKIALAWIYKWSGEKIPAIGEGVSETELDWDLPRKNPELCLSVIVHILSLISADPSNRYFQVLAAGPLEDLIIENGEAVIEEVETLARRSPEFRKLLNGTWLSRAKPPIRERLKKYLSDKW